MATERDHDTAPAAESNTDPSEITNSLDTAELTSESKEEEQQDQSAAFDPETGEINWDCPCLGGMADGTCGEEFKTAFACFVYSEEEPKGMDCIDAFKAMQDCFRAHPEEYAKEIAEEEGDADSDAETDIGDTDAGDAGTDIGDVVVGDAETDAGPDYQRN
ncbi:Oxidoreductase [Coemansia sp. RSA 2559]|nr:Oxidoreductase [Coemansia sp. RSA 2559]KAJ2869191.1 Oxidoreductase [Coemansia erecta]